MTTGAERSKAYRQRKLAAGYRLLHGRLTTEPSSRLKGPPPHGTRRRYSSYTYPCHCAECTEAVLVYNAAWRAANPDLAREHQRRAQAKRRAERVGAA